MTTMASTRAFNHILHRKHTVVSSISNTCVLYNFNATHNVRQHVPYSTKKSITQVKFTETDNKVQVGIAEVVKENTKSIGYLGVIIGGIGVTALMFYAIFNELFSSKSPNGVYTKALDRCMKHPKVVDALGEPIKAYGEETRRGRRNHVSSSVFTRNGVKCMNMKFYIQGIRRRGTVLLEVQEDASGNYVYSYLYVIIEGLMKTTIKIEDNRGSPEIVYDTAETDTLV